jgi:2-oxoisovalerate dehydrogenase E1 component
MVAQPTVEELKRRGASVEWIDARTLIPFDYACVIDSVRKTGRLVVIHAEGRTGGIGESVVAKLATHPGIEYKWNPARMRVVAADDGATPQAHILEYAYLPSVEKALEACDAVLDRKEAN